MHFIRFFLLLLLLQGCSNQGPRGVLRIGIDADWYPNDFGPQNSYVNGFTEDLLLEVARYTGLEFERIPANWDSLMDGLRTHKYDAVLTSMPPYEYNTAKYDFSSNFLDLGPVLIFPIHAPQTDLAKMDGELVGALINDPAIALLAKHPALVIRTYPTIPDLLTALANGDIQAAALNRVPAASYVQDLFANRLEIIGEPLTDAGLHLIAPKGENRLVSRFNKGLDSLRKKKTLDSLQKKWQL